MSEPTRKPAGTAVAAAAGPLLSLRHVTKRFGGVVAVQDVSFDVAEGELVGLIGPNGAGKSTLLNVISGVYRPSTGEIRVRGRRVDRLRTHAVARLGVARANQIPRPFHRLTVAENVLVAAQSTRGNGRARQKDHVRDVLELCDLQAQAGRPAGSLTLLNLKRLEVARALALQPDLLLLDEVGAGLVGREVDEVAELISGVNARGVTILLVEHVQTLVRALASRVIVLDWGRQIAAGTPAEIAENPEVIRTYLGTGDDAAGRVAQARERKVDARVLLRTEGLSVDYGKLRAVHDVQLELHEGEIAALLGANGAGKSSIARALAGVVAASGGRIWLDGEEITRLPAHARARRGLAICHEGRRLFTELSVRENLELAATYSRRATGRLSDGLDRVTELFPVLAERLKTPVAALSGGQQQMVAIARALIAEPRIMILDELSLGLAPTVIDELYEAIAGIRSLGVAVLLVEQNVFRSLAVADHVYVIERGRISLSASPDEVQRDDRLRAAYFGGTAAPAAG